jgi:hypothetical protein
MSGAAELPVFKKLVGYCECGHTADAHGSNGFICAACHCKKFVPFTGVDSVELDVTR